MVLQKQLRMTETKGISRRNESSMTNARLEISIEGGGSHIGESEFLSYEFGRFMPLAGEHINRRKKGWGDNKT